MGLMANYGHVHEAGPELKHIYLKAFIHNLGSQQLMLTNEGNAQLQQQITRLTVHVKPHGDQPESLSSLSLLGGLLHRDVDSQRSVRSFVSTCHGCPLAHGKVYSSRGAALPTAHGSAGLKCHRTSQWTPRILETQRGHSQLINIGPEAQSVARSIQTVLKPGNLLLECSFRAKASP